MFDLTRDFRLFRGEWPSFLHRPVFWLTLLLLILNDAWLKYAFPSWLTGKVSDFAGLFVLPLVVVAVLRVGGQRQRQVERIVFWAIGIWFAAMKLVPEVNEATVALWSWLAGRPVQIVLDPTDLVGLVALWPAWRLARAPLAAGRPWRRWQRAAAGSGLVVAALACLGSSCDEEFYGRLYLLDDTMYLSGNRVQTYDEESDRWIEYEVDHWSELDALLGPERRDMTPLAVTACLEDDSRCYRIDGQHQVDVSTDGGQSWVAAWTPPPGRFYFAQRAPASCDAPIEKMGPYDLAVLGNDDSHYVFAALGGQGVLVRTPDGQWTRQTLEGTRPTPWSVTTVPRAFRVVWPEWLAGLALGLLLWVALAQALWPEERWSRRRLALWLFLALAPLAGLVLAMAITFPDAWSVAHFVLAWEIIPAVMLIWHRLGAIEVSDRRRPFIVANLLWAAAGIGVMGFVFFAFWWWANGAITYYLAASLLGWGGAAAAAAAGWRLTRRYASIQ